VKDQEEILNKYDDEYPLESFEIKTCNFFGKYPFQVSKKDFNIMW